MTQNKKAKNIVAVCPKNRKTTCYLVIEVDSSRKQVSLVLCINDCVLFLINIIKTKMKKLLPTKSKEDKSNKENGKVVSDDFDEQFGNYRCQYCRYVSAQKWILDRHISTVHYKVCILQKLCICRKCSSQDSPKDPYRCRAFKNWH